MEFTIALLCEKKPGVVARAVGTLKRFDLSYRGHRSTDQENGHLRLTINAEGENRAPEALLAALLEISGVQDVLEMNGGGTAPAPAAPAPPPAAPGPPESIPVGDASSAVDRILAAYPRILSAVEAFQAGISPKERPEVLKHLGLQVGVRYGAGRPPPADVSDVESALERVVLPALKQIAVGDVEGHNLRILKSVFSKRAANAMYAVFDDAPERCDFLCGFIEGLLRSTPALAHVTVSEIQCKGAGDGACLFKTTS